MDFEVWAAFVAASAILLFIPGPSVVMIVACALGRGPRVAVPLACGIMLADAVLMTLTALGIGALLLAYPPALVALRWAGAGYLAWLGLDLWRAASEARVGEAPPPSARLARRAFVATMMNPLTIGFYVAFLPQFIDPARAFWPQVAILEASFLTLAALNTLAYAQLAGRIGAALAGPGAGRALRRVGGATMWGVGLWVLAAA